MGCYRVDVMADNVADVVECAGGWIFDHVMGGWAVNVVVRRPGDARPMEILGATVNRPTGSEGQAPQIFCRKRQEAQLSGTVSVRPHVASRRRP